MAISAMPHLNASAATTTASIVVAPGLRKVLVEAMLSDQYVDFIELPPAKSHTKAIASHLECQVVLIQSSDYLQAKRLTPDFGRRLQCFAIYTAVVLTKFPDRATSLMLYAANIAKLSQKFRLDKRLLKQGILIGLELMPASMPNASTVWPLVQSHGALLSIRWTTLRTAAL